MNNYERIETHKSYRRKSKYNNYLLFSIIYKIVIFLAFFKISIYEVNIEDQIEKELNNIKFNETNLTWGNVKHELEFLSNKYKYLIKYEKSISEDSPIWVMWYQGIENAPPLVQSCVQSIIINKAKHPVYLIDKYNFEKYIKLPSFIKEKLNNGTFSVTHFSDILRMGLLYKYGGYWIDSTYFVNTPLTKVDFHFYTIKKNYCSMKSSFIKCIWVGNFLAVPPNSFFATYGYMAFLSYWKKYNSLINYFLIDYIIHIAYTNIPEFKNLISNLPFLNCQNCTLVHLLNSNYKKDDFRCPLSKLTRRRNFTAYNKNGKTNYGYLIENYKLDIKNIKNNNYIIV